MTTPTDVFVEVFSNSSPCGYPAPCEKCRADALAIVQILREHGVGFTYLIDTKEAP